MTIDEIIAGQKKLNLVNDPVTEVRETPAPARNEIQLS